MLRRRSNNTCSADRDLITCSAETREEIIPVVPTEITCSAEIIIIIISGFSIYGAAVVPDSGVGNTWQRINNYSAMEYYEVGTMAVDGWAVTFATVRRKMGGAAARPGPSLLYQM